MTSCSLRFSRFLAFLFSRPWLAWLWDLPILPGQLQREWGIPYHFRILRMFHHLRTLSARWPRSRTFWVVGSNEGNAFAGNSAFLFLYHSARKENRAVMVWITQSRDVLRLLRSRGLPALHSRGLGGVLACGLAGTHVVSHNARDTNLWVSGGARRIQLWHGLPIKKLYWDVEGKESATWLFLNTWHGRTERFWKFRTPWNFGYGEHWAYASTGAVFANRLTRAFRGEASRFHNLGFARNDFILDPDPAFLWILGDHADTWRDIHARPGKVILYLPTWREIVGDAGKDRPFFRQWEALDRLLAERDMTLVFKGHGKVGETRMVPPQCGHIAVIPGDLDSTYLMAGSDVLVTDYSSVYVDFLLLDRPIGFFWFDEDYYTTREHELYEDMLENLPGPVMRTLEDWKTFLDACAAGEDPWAGARRKERDRLYEIQGGGSCERTVAFLESAAR